MTFGLILILIIASGLFSASEIALTSLSRAKVLSMQDDGRFGSAAITKLKQNPQRVLVSILVSNQAVNIVATFLATLWAFELFDDSNKASWLIIPFTFVLILFGSILPKTFALGFPERFARVVAYPLVGFIFMIRPIIYLFEVIINVFSRLLKVKQGVFNSISEKEIEAMIEIGADEGVIEAGQDVFLKHVLRFGETKVKEVMIPLKDIAALNVAMSRKDLIQFLDGKNHIEFPVYENDINTIKGIISLHELLQLLQHSKKKFPLKEAHLAQSVVVPKTATFIQLFKVLNDKNKRMAMVIDEYGQTVGLVTASNIMEEITGIRAKNNGPQPSVKKLDRNLWEADGGVRISQINEDLSVDLPYPEHEVLSLVVLKELKRFPEVDEVLKIDGIDIKIKRIEKNVVKKLEISKNRVNKTKKKV